MTTYERVASVTPTYEVHVYHDTGHERMDAGHNRRVLEAQSTFGYFVQHEGDLSGWRHQLTGEGFVLEKIGPDFYRAKIPDHGKVQVHTTIMSCQRHVFGLINICGHSLAGVAGCQCTMGDTGIPSGDAVFVAAIIAIALRRRRRRS
jgi:MYXO-CTERM domain-containing protein